MKAKLIYIFAALLTLTAASAAPRTSTETIHMVYQPKANGDYDLYLFPTGKILVCEEQPIQLIEPADPTNDPLILRCKHAK